MVICATLHQSGRTVARFRKIEEGLLPVGPTWFKLNRRMEKMTSSHISILELSPTRLVHPAVSDYERQEIYIIQEFEDLRGWGLRGVRI